MSKISSKQRYTQLVSWLESRPKKQQAKSGKNKSRLDYYDKKGFNSRRNSR